MNRYLAIVAALFAIVLGCAGDAGDPLGKSSAAIGSASLRPLPFGWNGSTVDLLAADAWSSCSWAADGTPINLSTASTPKGFADYQDEYFRHLSDMMTTASCGTVKAGGFPERWYKQRTTFACNYDSDSGAFAALSESQLPQARIVEKIDHKGIDKPVLGDAPDELIANANQNLRYPAINLCMAQRMRDLVPGAIGGEALLLGASEQLQLLEMVRERAQVAMMQYAVLGMILGSKDDIKPLSFTAKTANPGQTIWAVQQWARNTSTKFRDTMEKMGGDFAAAVQLHIETSTELAQLFYRSSSAHLARGGSPSSEPEDYWGPGSWNQRLLALLYGGDPLVQASGGPWQHFRSFSKPGTLRKNGATEDSVILSTTGVQRPDWPTAGELGFVDKDVRAPQVETMEGLARRYDLFDLVVAPLEWATSSSVCLPVDVAKTGNRLYRTIEAAIRTSDCDVTDTTGACVTIAASSIGDTSGFESFSLWKKHRVAPEHATALAAIAARQLGAACVSVNYRYFGRFDRRGSTNIDGAVTLRDGADDGRVVERGHEVPRARRAYACRHGESRALSGEQSVRR